MADPTTRSSTPPQSGRIAQQSPTNATVVPAYDDTAFPSIAFTFQLALNQTTRRMEFYNENGAWEGIQAAGSSIQSFYGPAAPTVGVNVGDRWYNTLTGLWNIWTGTAWLPGNASYSDTAPTSPSIGDAWYNLTNGEVRYWDGSGWVLGGSPTAPSVFTGSIPAAATAGSVWTDTYGVVRYCTTTYTSSPSMTYWAQLVTSADPLASLIKLSGVRIDCGEATAPPNPTPSTTITITAGMVWKDTQAASTELGSFFVYTGASWVKVTNAATLATVSAMTPAPAVAPAASPTLTVKPFTASMLLTTTDIAATSQIEYHGSATTGFTPGAGTLYSTTRSQVIEVRGLPDGTPFAAGTDYFFKVVAKNTLGSAPASSEVTAQLSLIDSGQVAEISASKVSAGELAAAMILTGSIQIGQIMLSADGGLVIPLANGGVINLPSDGSAAQFLGVWLEATQLLVDDNFELRGAANRIAGTLNLASNVTAPLTGPALATSWPSTAAGTAFDLTSGVGAWSLWDDGTNWVTHDYDPQALTGTGQLVRGFNKTTGAETTLLDLSATAFIILSIARVGTDWYLLVADTGGGSGRWIRKYNSSWVYQSNWTVPIQPNCYLTNQMGSDGTNLFFVHFRYTDNKTFVISTTPSGGSAAVAMSPTSLGGSSSYPVTAYLWVGTADFTAQRFIFGMVDGHTYVYDSGGARHANQEWGGPNGDVQHGLYWDGTNFRSNPGDKVWTLSTVRDWTTRAARWSQYDSDTTGGLTHETAWSPVTTFTQISRTYFSVTTPAPQDAGGADDPNAIRHYIQNGGSGSYYRQADVTSAPWSVTYGVPNTNTPGPELSPNPGFETNTTGWTPTNNTLTRVTTQHAAGVAAGQLSSTAAGNMSIVDSGSGTGGMPVEAGATYLVSGMAKAATVARLVQIRVDWWDAAGTFINQFVGTGVSDGTAGWTTITENPVAPSNAAFARRQYIVASTAGAAEVHYVDELSMRKSIAATAVSTPDFSGVSNPGIVASSAVDANSEPSILLKGNGSAAIKGHVHEVGSVLSGTAVPASPAANGVATNIASVTYTVRANRKYRLTWQGNITPGTAGQWVSVDLFYGVGATTSGTACGATMIDCRAAGRVVGGTAVAEFTYTGTDNTSINFVAVMTGQGGTAQTFPRNGLASMLVVDEIP